MASAATAPSIKVDPSVDPSDQIDPDSVSPINSGDEDAYEDTGELEMPKQDQVRAAWLARVPKMLYNAWSAIDEDEEIQVGVMRRYKSGKVQLILDQENKHNENTTKQFELKTIDSRAQNVFVFSEKDLPGYKTRPTRNDRKPNGQQGDKKNFLGPQDRRKGGKFKRFQPFIRRAIPKQTSLNARISNEVNCVAIENEEYHSLFKKHLATEAANRPGIQFLVGDAREYDRQHLGMRDKRGVRQPGFESFIKAGQVQTQKKLQENKAARMSRNELLDRLYGCFKRYRYWTVKALRQELNQPEAYLREVLNMIAELVKSGSFTGNYKLKPEAELEAYIDAKKEGEEAEGPSAAGDEETSAMEEDEAEEDPDADDDEDLPMQDAL